jgi:murein L,D-transpeptidase YcbB/YkuD
MGCVRVSRIVAGTAVALILAVTQDVRAASDAPPAAPASTELSPPSAEPAGAQNPGVTDIGTHPLANLPAADLPVAEKLRELVAGRLDKWVDSKPERAAVEAFYLRRGFAPLWIEKGAPNERTRAAIARLKAADADGLRAQDYPAPDLKGLAGNPEMLAGAELRLTATILTYARHAQAGRIDPARISHNIEYVRPTPDPAAVLVTIADSPHVAKALDGFNPPHDGFRRLKAKLAELRAGSAKSSVNGIPSGAKLKIGMRDSRVPQLRQRLGIRADGTNLTYDAKLAKAVKTFQRRRGMAATGELTQETIDALNGPAAVSGPRRERDIEVILSNMERWRWLPRDLGQNYVMVNVPDYTVKVVRDGATVFRTRIVVGKPETPTPVFSDEMETIIVNPSWSVPDSIAQRQFFPLLRNNPGALARMGIHTVRTRNGIAFRQPPGERNALGRIKFDFPNRFAVYLHDTPQKHLFAQERRAFSSGCMRVENPTEFAEVLLSIAVTGERYTADRLTKMFGKGPRWIKFANRIPVHLTYMNAYVDDDGRLVMREYLYRLDSRVQAALNGEKIQVAAAAAPAVRRPARTAYRPARTSRPVVADRYGAWPYQPYAQPSYSYFGPQYR